MALAVLINQAHMLENEMSPLYYEYSRGHC